MKDVGNSGQLKDMALSSRTVNRHCMNLPLAPVDGPTLAAVLCVEACAYGRER